MSTAEIADMKLENDIIPVTDVDRAKAFYQQLGWRLDDDVAPLDGIRFVQFTPPGSPASVTFGLGSLRLSLAQSRAPSSSPISKRRTMHSSSVAST
jgi:catechol 2,3-dioxygenase-like lactoylglutathione lyase family enzyme